MNPPLDIVTTKLPGADKPLTLEFNWVLDPLHITLDVGVIVTCGIWFTVIVVEAQLELNNPEL